MRRVWSSKRGGHNGSSASGQTGELRGLVRIPLGRVAALGDGALLRLAWSLQPAAVGCRLGVREGRTRLQGNGREQVRTQKGGFEGGNHDRLMLPPGPPGPSRHHMMIASPGHLGEPRGLQCRQST